MFKYVVTHLKKNDSRKEEEAVALLGRCVMAEKNQECRNASNMKCNCSLRQTQEFLLDIFITVIFFL